MSEYRENTNEPERIDLMYLLSDIVKGLRKLWLVVVALAVIFALKSFLTVNYSYMPQYVASATMAVSSAQDDVAYVNEKVSEQMAELFPYIMRSGALQNAILEDMGLESMPGSINMTAEEGTNFFTITASAGDGETAYELLQATLRQYPEVAKFVVGEINMEILDETGVPNNTGKESVVRGSIVDGAVKGAILGLIIVAIYALTRNTVKQRKQLKRIINLEDLGSMPHIALKKRKKKSGVNTLSLKNRRIPQVYVESMRKIRIKTLKKMEENNHRSLIVTSSVPGEGKTTIAANLAIAFARQGKKVILVDCDLRNPSVSQIFEEKDKHPGIAAVLEGKVTLTEAITPAEVENGSLKIVYGGEPDTEAAKWLGTDRMGKVINVLEKNADIVILDTAPSNLLTDASALAKYVDAALYVVKCDWAKKSQIRGGVQALGESGIDILGYVFNDDMAKKSGGYGYGYSYGYKNYSAYYGKTKGQKKTDSSGRVYNE